MPQSHQRHAEWTPSRLIHWGNTLSEEVGLLFEEILKTKPHPEQGFRSCLGIMRLAKVHGEDRLKKACGRALALRAYSYQRVKNILTHKLEAAGSTVPEKGPDIRHEHLRGASYYQPEKKGFFK
jgi:transposase